MGPSAPQPPCLCAMLNVFYFILHFNGGGSDEAIQLGSDCCVKVSEMDACISFFRLLYLQACLAAKHDYSIANVMATKSRNLTHHR